MLRKSLTLATVTVGLTAALATPAFAQISETVGTSRCSVTTTGPTFAVTTLPNPSITPNGSVGASVNCPV
jgi:siroheme synthase